MKKLKSSWTTLSGSISSIIPLFFACCNTGACVGVCASPVASLFGISSASFSASPLFNAIVPLLLAFSSVSFTISYYNLYVLPKRAALGKDCTNDCACDTPQDVRKVKISKWIFWIGLLASIFFFTYFEVQKYKAEKELTETSACVSESDTDTTLVAMDSLKTIDSTGVKKKCCSDNTKCE